MRLRYPVSWLFLHTMFNWVRPDKTQLRCDMTPMDTYMVQARIRDSGGAQGKICSSSYRRMDTDEKFDARCSASSPRCTTSCRRCIWATRAPMPMPTHVSPSAVSAAQALPSLAYAAEPPPASAPSPSPGSLPLSRPCSASISKTYLLYSLSPPNTSARTRAVIFAATSGGAGTRADGVVLYKFFDYLVASSHGLHDAEKLYAEVREVLHLGAAPIIMYTNGADHFALRNASMLLTISHKRITSRVDVQLDRELIQEGATGGLVIFEDHPSYWDACNVEIHHLEKTTPLESAKVSVVAQSPLRASMRAWVISLDALPASTALDFRSMLRFNAWVDSSAPSRPSSRIHCTRGGVGGAYTAKVRVILVDCVALSVAIKPPAHAFSAHSDGVDGATTAEGLERAWGGAGTPSLS
ncbi:hypothetical protein B0H14DRAFT_3712034 [Mycena olivaceomarginata]|nr:hypothetical protein B0H14DRAFT_3712034 [Mycena olivaceomarginata]